MSCNECGGSRNLLEPHKPTCSQFKHFVDDHYDSACMRGTCKHCNPEYVPNFAVKFTLEEREQLVRLLEKRLRMPLEKKHNELLRSSLNKLKFQ